MKFMTTKCILLPAMFLGLAAVSAMAAPLDCSVYTTLAIAQSNNGTGCTIAGTDKIFDNFHDSLSTGVIDNDGEVAPPGPDATQIGLSITNTGGNSGVFSVVFSFQPLNNGVGFKQTQNMYIDYSVAVDTVNFPLQFINSVAGSATAATRSFDGAEDATVNVEKDICKTGTFSNTNPSLGAGTCPGGFANTATPFTGAWQISPGADTDPTSELPDNTTTQGPTATTGLNLTSVGVLDSIVLSGGDVAGSDDGQFTANINSVENDFTQGTSSGAPEPGTFVLLGGALVGVGALRRRKKTA